MQDNANPVLCIFARAPVAGQAKTRLHTRYTPTRAGAIARVLIELTIQRAVANWPGQIEVWVTPDRRHAVFEQLVSNDKLSVHEQPPGDLGARMQAALIAPRKTAGPAAVMGTDIPHAPAHALELAYRSLCQGRNVFGPAVDGGFWFLGLHTPAPCGFDRVNWDDGDTVAAQTLAQAARCGVQFATRLVELNDIDTPADLDHVTLFDDQLAHAVRIVLA